MDKKTKESIKFGITMGIGMLVFIALAIVLTLIPFYLAVKVSRWFFILYPVVIFFFFAVFSAIEYKKGDFDKEGK